MSGVSMDMGTRNSYSQVPLPSDPRARTVGAGWPGTGTTWSATSVAGVVLPCTSSGPGLYSWSLTLMASPARMFAATTTLASGTGAESGLTGRSAPEPADCTVRYQ